MSISKYIQYYMNRLASIHTLENNSGIWDLIIIGGGATGLGTALDAALRGYKTLLLEQSDFTKGTSSRSTKLVHGGVRYLAQGNIKLVLEALYERGLLLQNAPHLTYNQSFIIPSFSWWDSLKYGVGLKLYDMLAGKLSLGKSTWTKPQKVQQQLPNLKFHSLKAGIIYHDGQFDDARLGINLAQSAVEQGATLINYMKATKLQKDASGKVNGVVALDLESSKSYSLQAKVVINATGVFVDPILQMDDPKQPSLVRVSQGAHIVLDRSFLPSSAALMIPKTDDGRVLFAIPWHAKLLVGTTDLPVDKTSLEPCALDEEVDFILDTFGRYVEKKPTRQDVLSVFAGLRPLVQPSHKGAKTKEISRNHKLIASESGLITITGGKWTTYRKMAQDVVDKAAEVGHLKKEACRTHHFKIHGATSTLDANPRWAIYGTDLESIRALMAEEPDMAQQLHPNYDFIKAEIVWMVRHEMARTVEDTLARRLRILFLDARAAMDMAPIVAGIMAKELHKDTDWVSLQLETFTKVAQGYLLKQ